jgi:VWFA-related protein
VRHASRLLFGLLLVGLASVVADRALYAIGPDQAAQTQAPSFRSGTTLVQVDVIVRGRGRHFVTDLRKADFQVLEDGVPQRIDQFYLVADQEMDAEFPWTQDSPKDGAKAEPVPVSSPEQRVFVLAFDQPHLAFGNGRRAREAALTFLRGQLRPGDLAGVVVGNRMTNRRLTSDRSELVSAVNGVEMNPDAMALYSEYFREWPRFRDLAELWDVWRGDASIKQGVVARALSEGGLASSQDLGKAADVVTTTGDNEAREATDQRVSAKAQRGVDEFRRATNETITMLSTLTRGLARMPGRKTVILLSDGFVVEEAWAPLRDVEAAAARADVRIYAIDTRGLNNETLDGDIVTKTQPEAIGTMRSPDIAYDGLAELTTATGGYAVMRRNDMADVLSDIDRDTSSYYVIGYRPTQSTADGKFRKIEVKVARKGVEVRARKGYVAGYQ